MAEYPAMLLFTDAYLADTTHLSEVEHGRYLLMLMHIWRMPNRRFPNDNNWLARKFGKTVDEVVSDLRPLIAEFFKNDGNYIWHNRIDKQFAHCKDLSEKRSGAAKARWKPAATIVPQFKPDADNARETNEKEECISSASISITNILKKEPPSEVRKKAQRTASPATRGSRLSDAWAPSEADLSYASQQGLSRADTERIAMDFRDYWAAKSGQAATKLDWHATWRTWIRREIDRRKQRNDRTAYVAPHAQLVTEYLQGLADLPDERDTASTWGDTREPGGTVVALRR